MSDDNMVHFVKSFGTFGGNTDKEINKFLVDFRDKTDYRPDIVSVTGYDRACMGGEVDQDIMIVFTVPYWALELYPDL